MLRAPLLVLTRTFDAPQRRVFEAWTRPDRLARGWALPGFTVTALQNELWPGGTHRTTLRAPDGAETQIDGVYHDICPPSRLALTQRWSENGELGPETLMTVDFAPRDGNRTFVRLELSGFASETELALHRAGVSECLDRIADYLAETAPSGPDRLRQCRNFCDRA